MPRSRASRLDGIDAQLGDLEVDEILQKRTEATADFSKEPITALLIILAIDKTIDIVRDVVKDRRERKRDSRYRVSIDGGASIDMTADQVLELLDNEATEG